PGRSGNGRIYPANRLSRPLFRRVTGSRGPMTRRGRQRTASGSVGVSTSNTRSSLGDRRSACLPRVARRMRDPPRPAGSVVTSSGAPETPFSAHVAAASEGRTMRLATAYFAGIGTVAVAIAAGLGGGLLLGDIMSPQQPKYPGSEMTKLEQRTSQQPIRAADGPSQPVPYMSPTQAADTVAELRAQPQQQAQPEQKAQPQQQTQPQQPSQQTQT